MSSQASFSSLDKFLSIQEDIRDNNSVGRPSYFIPGVNGRARCLSGIKEGDTRTIYSCPTILQLSRDTSMFKKYLRKSNVSNSHGRGQTKTRIGTDSCTPKEGVPRESLVILELPSFHHGQTTTEQDVSAKNMTTVKNDSFDGDPSMMTVSISKEKSASLSKELGVYSESNGLKRPNLSNALIIHDGNSKTTSETDINTLSSRSSFESIVQCQRALGALNVRCRTVKTRNEEVQKDIEYFLTKFKIKQNRWKRIAYLDELVDLTPLPIVDERYATKFDDAVCGTVVSDITAEQSVSLKKERKERRLRGKRRKKSIDHNKIRTETEKHTSNKNRVGEVSPTSVHTIVTPATISQTAWISELPRIRSSSTDYSDVEGESVVSLCSMDGGKTNLRFRRAQRLAAVSSEDIRCLFLKELAEK